MGQGGKIIEAAGAGLLGRPCPLPPGGDELHVQSFKLAEQTPPSFIVQFGPVAQHPLQPQDPQPLLHA